MSTPDTISLLNRLIITQKNGEQALRAAAEEACHEDLRESLMEFSRFFGASAHELQDAVRELGGRPPGRDERMILDEIKADAVGWDTPPRIHAILERQYEGACERHQAVRRFRQQMPA